MTFNYLYLPAPEQSIPYEEIDCVFPWLRLVSRNRSVADVIVCVKYGMIAIQLGHESGRVRKRHDSYQIVASVCGIGRAEGDDAFQLLYFPVMHIMLDRNTKIQRLQSPYRENILVFRVMTVNESRIPQSEHFRRVLFSMIDICIGSVDVSLDVFIHDIDLQPCRSLINQSILDLHELQRDIIDIPPLLHSHRVPELIDLPAVDMECQMHIRLVVEIQRVFDNDGDNEIFTFADMEFIPHVRIARLVNELAVQQSDALECRCYVAVTPGKIM